MKIAQNFAQDYILTFDSHYLVVQNVNFLLAGTFS